MFQGLTNATDDDNKMMEVRKFECSIEDKGEHLLMTLDISLSNLAEMASIASSHTEEVKTCSK